MVYRYCPDCDEWLETSDYTVDESGETVCPEHRALHGYCEYAWTERQLRGHLNITYSEIEDEVAAAHRQGIIR